MTPEEREKMYVLCKLIQEEQDPKQLTELIRELNDLLEEKLNRIDIKRNSD